MPSFSLTLQHRIKVLRPPGLDVVTDDGQPPTEYQLLAEMWADVRLQGGLELIKAGAVTPTARASIRIRYRSDIDSSMRVQHGSTIYNIVAVLPDTVSKRHVDLVCEAIPCSASI